MLENSQKTLAALVACALALATCVLLYGLSSASAAAHSGAAPQEIGLEGVKPIVVIGKADETRHITEGWKLFLVGTNTYVNLDEKYDLHYSVQDVEALKEQFIALGVPESNITILTSKSRRDFISDKDNIDKAFDAFIESLQEGDAAFVYLSGHGFYFKVDNQAYYAPRDFEAQTSEMIRATGVSINDMMERLKDSPATFKWMTVDACRNDPTELIPGLSKRGAVNVSGVESFIVQTGDLPPSFVFMQGCEDGQFSLESKRLEHGLLTHAFLEALQYDDNPADKTHSGELKLMELLIYVQDRTNELAHMCRDSANKPLAQKPTLTNNGLQNTTFLTNLRHEGLTHEQWQERMTEEERFSEYLQNSDFERAQDSLTTLIDYYPGGTESELYQSLKKRLDDAKLEKEKVDALAQNRVDAEEYYTYARQALDAKEYASALGYIDDAIELNDDPKYTKFRSGVLARGIKGAVDDAIIAGNVQKAKNLNKYLAELDAKTAKENESRIAELEQPKPGKLEHPKPGALLTLTIAGVVVNFHWAPAGTFTMGSPEDEEERDSDEIQHEVTLTRGFWIAETETTQELWKAVMGNNPSFFTDSDQLPVEEVSWNDCRNFVQTLNRSCSNVLPSGFQYAMPTEAQWEYACRAGTKTPFNFGSVLYGDKANSNGVYPSDTTVKGSYKEKTAPVKSYAPNDWGLYDMHGNVLEWCSDWYDSDYYTDSSATQDPTGPSSSSNRALRGGSWSRLSKNCRSASRLGDGSTSVSDDYGFRLVLVQQ